MYVCIRRFLFYSMRYTLLMGGPTLPSRNRSLVVATLFAVSTLAVLALVWYWPEVLRLLRGGEIKTPTSEMTVDEKHELLQKMYEADVGTPKPPAEERKDLLDEMHANSGASGARDTRTEAELSAEREKRKSILDGLNTP